MSHQAKFVFFMILMGMISSALASDINVRRDLEAGCEFGAKTFSERSAKLESLLSMIIDKTAPNSSQRHEMLKLYNEWYENENDQIRRAERSSLDEYLNSNEYRNHNLPERGLREIRIEMYYRGLRRASDVTRVIVHKRVSERILGGSEDRYRRLIEEECKNLSR